MNQVTKDEALKLALDWYDSGHEDREEFQAMIENLLASLVQEPVAHCEAGPRHCQQCHLEDRSLALAAAVRYVKNNAPKLVSDEICMALTTPTEKGQP